MKPLAERKRKQAGYSLVEAAVLMGVLAISAAATQSLLAAASRGAAVGDFKSGVSALSSTVKDRVSCSKTFEHVDLDKDCFPSSEAKPIVLRDAAGDPITESLESVSGVFRPLDNSTQGSGKIGPYRLRAYCDKSVKSLVVRYARPGKPGEFLKHPSTKLPLDWQTSSSNPLFGLPERTLCASNVGGNSGKPAGFITAKTIFRRAFTPLEGAAGLQVAGPTNSRLVKISAKGHNLADYGSGSAETEDHMDLYVMVDLAAETSTGYYSVVGGSGEANTILFSWNDRAFDSMAPVDGDRIVTAEYGAILASTFRPRFTFDKNTGIFRMEQLAMYYPAQYVFLFEFYGD